MLSARGGHSSETDGHLCIYYLLQPALFRRTGLAGAVAQG